MLEILSVEAGKGANVAVHTHSLFVRHVRLVPFHAVGEGNVDVRMIRQVNGVFVRAGNVNADPGVVLHCYGRLGPAASRKRVRVRVEDSRGLVRGGVTARAPDDFSSSVPDLSMFTIR